MFCFQGDSRHEHGRAREECLGQARGNSTLTVFGADNKIEGKMDPKRIALKASLIGTSPEAPEQPHLSSREKYGTAVDGCKHADGSSELGEVIFL